MASGNWRRRVVSGGWGGYFWNKGIEMRTGVCECSGIPDVSEVTMHLDLVEMVWTGHCWSAAIATDVNV